MKTEEELLELIRQTHSYGSIEDIKDYIAENAIYDRLDQEQPVIGKERVLAKISHWFEYNRNFNVWMEAIKHDPTAKSMAYVSLAEDGYKIGSYVIIESEEGLITRYYEVNRNNTRRAIFQSLKENFFEPRAKKASEPAKEKPKMKPGMTFKENSKLGMEILAKQPPLTFEEMKASVERVHASSLQSVKERIENAKTDPNTKIDELMKEQAEIAKVLQGVITASLPVIPLKNDKWRLGTWYEITQPDQHKATISLKHPFYFEWDAHCGIGLVIIKLSEHVLGYDETLLIRFEKREDGIYDAILLAVSKKLSEMGYDSVVFYETEPLQLKEVYSISISHSEATK